MWQYFFPRIRGARHVSPFPFGYWHRGALFARSIVLFILLKIFWFTSSNSSAFSCNCGSSITHCRYASNVSPSCFSNCPAWVLPHSRLSSSLCSRSRRSSRRSLSASRSSSDSALSHNLHSSRLNPRQSSPARYPKSSLTPFGIGLPFIKCLLVSCLFSFRSGPESAAFDLESCHFRAFLITRRFSDHRITRSPDHRSPDFHPHPPMSLGN